MEKRLKTEEMNQLIGRWAEDYLVYGPVRLAGKGAFSDTDSVRYGQIGTLAELELKEKSHFSFKEILLPISETLFFFTEDTVKEADGPKKGAVIFLRSCDLQAVKRLDEIYLHNGFSDHYYKRIRDKVKFVLLGCEKSFEDCFCVSMGTNKAEGYDAALAVKEGGVHVEIHCPELAKTASDLGLEGKVEIPFAEENDVKVTVPKGLTEQVFNAPMWDEYDTRCINCGRCNFVCPTCTCFTMQDIFYTDNGKAGERRRVWASCMVDGYTEVAGGGSYRQKNSQRMRFKTMHKVYDYNKRYGYHMCVGCGRCDRACPEYISFSGCINKLEKAAEEASSYVEK